MVYIVMAYIVVVDTFVAYIVMARYSSGLCNDYGLYDYGLYGSWPPRIMAHTVMAYMSVADMDYGRPTQVPPLRFACAGLIAGLHRKGTRTSVTWSNIVMALHSCGLRSHGLCRYGLSAGLCLRIHRRHISHPPGRPPQCSARACVRGLR